MSSEQPEDTNVQGEAEPKDEVPETEEEVPEVEEREKIQWPFTKGEGFLQLRYFDLVDLPEFQEDEPDLNGKLLMALISEILHLKGTLAVLVKERQKASFEDWLASQGKGLRDPGAATGIMGQRKRKR